MLQSLHKPILFRHLLFRFLLTDFSLLEQIKQMISFSQPTLRFGLRQLAGICSVTLNSVFLPISWERTLASLTKALAFRTSPLRTCKLFIMLLFLQNKHHLVYMNYFKQLHFRTRLLSMLSGNIKRGLL